MAKKCEITPQKEKGKEREAKSYEDARNKALKELGVINPATRKPSIGRLPKSPGLGKIIGFEGTTAKGVNYKYRLDYDPEKGPHINLEKGKGKCQEKISFKFPGNEDHYKSLLKVFQR